MFIIIISLIMAIAVFFIINYINAEILSENQRKIPKILAVAPLLLIFLATFTIVPTGTVGVKTAWGKVTGSVNEGIVFKAPWENVYQISTKVQKINRQQMEGSTKDLQMISGIDVDINYQVLADKAIDLYSRVGTEFADIVIAPAITQSIKSQIAQFNAEELANARGQVAESMSKQLNEVLGEYGIQVVSVSLNNFDFSAEYNAAIESKAVALQETQAAQQRLEKARVEAEQKVVEAKAQAEANDLLQRSLNEQVLREEFIKKWNGELPKVMGSDSIVSTDLIK